MDPRALAGPLRALVRMRGFSTGGRPSGNLRTQPSARFGARRKRHGGVRGRLSHQKSRIGQIVCSCVCMSDARRPTCSTIGVTPSL
jgi:hypothetical protein